MSNHFPQAEIEVSFSFCASHYLDQAASRKAHEPHTHTYNIWVGMRHEWNINRGWFYDVADIERECGNALEKYEGANLNEMLAPVPPTLEAVASHVLLSLPYTVSYVKAQCLEDNNAKVRVQRNWIADRLREAWK